MTEHNKETAQAIIKLAYQQMQAMPQNQQVQNQQVQQQQQPARKPTVGERVSTGVQAAQGLDKMTQTYRKQRRREEKGALARRVYQSRRSAGHGILGSFMKSRKAGKMLDHKKGKVKGVVGQVVGNVMDAADRGVSGFSKGLKSRTAGKIDGQVKTGAVPSGRAQLYAAGKGIEAAGRGSRMDRLKGLASRVSDSASEGYRRGSGSDFRDERRASARHMAAHEDAAKRKPGSKVRAKALDKAFGARVDMHKSKAKGVVRGAARGAESAVAHALLPGTQGRRNAVSLAGKSLSEGAKASAKAKKNADKMGAGIDRLLGNR